jgi:hypothetical protein
MIVTSQQLAELEEFFRTAVLPKTLQLNLATTMTDVPAFIDRTLSNLRRSDISEAALRPRFDHLLQIKSLLAEPSRKQPE